jgi:putative ABC transport system permease protein
VAAIAVVIAAGVMTLMIAVTSLDAIRLSMERFYASHQFGDVFMPRWPGHRMPWPSACARSPESTGSRPGWLPRCGWRCRAFRSGTRPDSVDSRWPPAGPEPLYLRAGSLPESGRADQVVISEPFAEAHDLRAGDGCE